MNRDFVEMLRALSGANAEYLVVGAHAVAAHGYVRATKDLDIWINPTEDNARRVWQALTTFGAPLEQIRLHDLTTAGNIYQIGIDPVRIDIMTSVEGVAFAEAYGRRTHFTEAGVQVPLMSKEDLIRVKRAAGRAHDLRDAEELERLK